MDGFQEAPPEHSGFDSDAAENSVGGDGLGTSLSGALGPFTLRREASAGRREVEGPSTAESGRCATTGTTSPVVGGFSHAGFGLEFVDSTAAASAHPTGIQG